MKFIIKLKQIFIYLTDVAAEKTQKSLFAGIEGFNPSNLKHTETQEKNPLPDKEGKLTNKNIYYESYVIGPKISNAIIAYVNK